MNEALRSPSRWAGLSHTLAITAVLSAALGACTSVDNVLYGAREGTVEYPGSASGSRAEASYVVMNKDTVDSVSQRFGVGRQTIIDSNRLQPPSALQPGQTISIPGARVMTSSGPSVETAAASSSPTGPVKSEKLAPPPQGEAPRSAAPAAEPGQPTPLSPAAATASSPPPSGPTPRFEWPVRGKIITPYGTAGGQKSDGIDIQVDKGAAVKAADGGTVVYSGDDVPRLGNLLLVEHSAGYITAYGNNDTLLVKKGDAVKKGQTIARAGSSGGVPSPRLHFEIRRGGSKTIDPTTMLPSQ
jgi:murein DD-endopeptidase MepM/ murein hydrolase activator NlpD